MKKLSIFLLLAGMFLLAGCINRVAVGAIQTDSQSVELGDVNSVQVDIQMGVGELNEGCAYPDSRGEAYSEAKIEVRNKPILENSGGH